MRLLVVLFGFAAFAHAADQAEKIACPTGPPKQIFIKQGEYSPKPGTKIQLENFAANIVPLSKEMPLCLKNETLVQGGSIFIDSASLSKLFNDKAGADPEIKDMAIKSDGQNLSITGRVKKLISIDFEIDGPVKPAQHGDVRMQVENIHADGIPVKSLMKMLGSNLGSMMGPDSARGISVEDNTLIFHTEQLMHFRGEITAVRLLKDGARLEFGSPKQELQSGTPKQPLKTAHAVAAQTPTQKPR